MALQERCPKASFGYSTPLNAMQDHHAPVVRRAVELRECKQLLKIYKAANTSVQLQKAAKELCTLLAALLTPASEKEKKAKAVIFIEAFNAAFESLQRAAQDQARLSAALATAKFALAGLKDGREFLKGRKFEVEIQQYSLIRRLAALKSYSEVCYS